MEYLFLIIGVSLLVLGLGFTYFHGETLKKKAYDVNRRYIQEIYIQVAANAVAGLGFGWLVFDWTSQGDFSPLMVFLSVLSAFIFFTLLLLTFSALWIRESSLFVQKVEKFFSYTILLSSLATLVFGLLSAELLHPLINFPLPKGIPFDQPLVTFYAISIMTGALVAYWLVDRAFIKKGYPRGYIEDVFLIAFPSGILGARLWYVWGQWEVEFANQPFWRIFAVWEGGLAIMGGALLGAVSGILYVIYRKRDINIFDGIDIALPTILVAQAIGRWGNFFNQEVYGGTVETWTWLPSFIQSQMTINGDFKLPLFLIEGLINLLGYFVLVYLVGQGLKKYRYPGDIGLLYPVWYGLTRVILEPLRDSQYIMYNFWSFFWGIAFVVLGLLGILLNHLVQDYLKRKKSL